FCLCSPSHLFLFTFHSLSRSPAATPDLHSFPTRRSSDLSTQRIQIRRKLPPGDLQHRTCQQQDCPCHRNYIIRFTHSSNTKISRSEERRVGKECTARGTGEEEKSAEGRPGALRGGACAET